MSNAKHGANRAESPTGEALRRPCTATGRGSLREVKRWDLFSRNPKNGDLGNVHLLKNMNLSSPVGFEGNRFHCWTFVFSRGLKEIDP